MIGAMDLGIADHGERAKRDSMDDATPAFVAQDRN
jgi:hypothetical protein